MTDTTDTDDTGKHESSPEEEGALPSLEEALAAAHAILTPEEATADDLPFVQLERCEISFMINVTDVATLAEAMEVAAGSLGRYGMDAFYVLATDPDTGRQWIVHNGQVFDAEEAVEALAGQGEQDKQD